METTNSENGSFSAGSNDRSDVGDIDSLKNCFSSYGNVEFEQSMMKKPKLEIEELGFRLPPGLLNPTPLRVAPPLSVVLPLPALESGSESEPEPMVVQSTNSTRRMNRQFCKAGDYYDECFVEESALCSGGMDHLRVHPKFLHSNATSHKWALGAFAELLDNAVDEFCNGATYVDIDMLRNNKYGSKMLLVQDNGGGMTPDKMRHCMSLGYSSKSRLANTIGQYGNGFKTSTMRLGADVIVFSCSQNSEKLTRSIGLLSYTFLRSTKQEDIVVPMIDYEKEGKNWGKIMKSSTADWTRNLQTIVEWSPYSSEQDLLDQFNFLEGKGTRIIIYNLWEDEEGNTELDFDTDPHDIQIRGVNRDEKNIEMAKQYPNSTHFFTYKHSLRSYSAILYLSLPTDFRINLRGKEVKHHRIENDMMLSEDTTYKPKDPHISENGVPEYVEARVKTGFAKDAHFHIDIQGFNVYHKNRLIKPFWRVWNAAGSGGRGVIRCIEANFVKPAHDKQDFEHSLALTRLVERLRATQKKFWSTHCHEIGYADKRATGSRQKPELKGKSSSSHDGSRLESNKDSDKRPQHPDIANHEEKTSHKVLYTRPNHEQDGEANYIAKCSNPKAGSVNNEHVCKPSTSSPDTDARSKLEVQSGQLRKRSMEEEESAVIDLLDKLNRERKKRKSLENQVEEANEKLKEANDEQEAAFTLLSQERMEREEEEERLRKRLQDASETINKLLERIRQLEGQVSICKVERN